MDIQSTGGCYIPEVVFCDARLSSTEKLLFGRIMGLSGKEGYCWASNEYLGSNVKLHKDNVSKSITKLSKLGMLKSFVELDDQKRVIRRKLYPLINFEAKHQGGLVKTARPLAENTNTPTDENTKYRLQYKRLQEDTLGGGGERVLKTATSPKAQETKTSKNSLTPCTPEDIQAVAKSLSVSVSAVKSVHDSILDLISAGEFKHKTTFYTLKQWIRMRIEKGTLQVYTNQTYGSNPIPFDPLAD